VIINQSTLSTLRQGLQARFKSGLQSKPPMEVERFATLVPSTTLIENYPFAAFLDSIRKWVGPRQVGNLVAKNLAVTNDDYEATIGIPANAIEDDQIGIYGEVAEGKARQCAALWGKLAIEALYSNGNWLDGAAFFGTSRTFGGNTISNYTASALSQSTLETAIQTMQSYLGYDDQPLGVTPDLLIVGPKLQWTAFDLLKNQTRITVSGTGEAAAISQRTAGLLDFMVSPYLIGTYDDYWFVLDTKQVLKPVLVQKRKEGPLEALDKPTDPNVFFGTVGVGGDSVVPGGVYIYGSHYRGAAALALPQLAYGGIVA